MNNNCICDECMYSQLSDDNPHAHVCGLNLSSLRNRLDRIAYAAKRIEKGSCYRKFYEYTDMKSVNAAIDRIYRENWEGKFKAGDKVVNLAVDKEKALQYVREVIDLDKTHLHCKEDNGSISYVPFFHAAKLEDYLAGNYEEIY